MLVPAILAEANEVGADGKAMIAAYVAGYEIWADSSAATRTSTTKGWHPTAMFGALAAAGASAVAAQARRRAGKPRGRHRGVARRRRRLQLRLDDQAVQVGRAAQSGLLATRLAEAGMTASPDAIEDELGFLRAISPKGAVDTTSEAELGRTGRSCSTASTSSSIRCATPRIACSTP